MAIAEKAPFGDVLLEADVKLALIESILSEYLNDDASSLIQEFSLMDGARRADVVFINRGQIRAYEIKTEADRLDRLPGQVDAYMHHFDEVVVVAGARHVEAVRKCVPNQVGVWELDSSSDVCAFRELRAPETMARSRKVDLVAMMTASDLRSALRAEGVKVRKDARRSHLVRSIMRLSRRSIREYAIDSIRRRHAPANERFRDELSRNGLSANALRTLSRFQSHASEDGMRQSGASRAFGLSEEALDRARRQVDVFEFWAHQESDEPEFGPVPDHIKRALKTA